MDDVRVPPGRGIPRGVVIPSSELIEQFSHASGPGGQGVNTSDSRVQLTLDLATSTAFTPEQCARLLDQLAFRLAGTVLTISASEQRSQLRNRAAARERLAALIAEALVPDAPRRATKPTRGSQHRRLAAKRSRSETKQGRRRPDRD